MTRERLPLPETSLSRPEAEAARWLILRRDGGMSVHDEREYRVWLERNPANRAAAEKIERYWNLMGTVADDPEIMALTERRARQAGRPVRVLRGLAVAACLVAAVALGWNLEAALYWGLEGASLPTTTTASAPARPGAEPLLAKAESVAERRIRTAVGESQTVTLEDGSVVTVDTDSILHVGEIDGERRMVLERGRAYFKVARDETRPFLVVAGDKTVVATGTEFAVDLNPAAVRVTLVEGSVRVEEQQKKLLRDDIIDLRPGWQLTAKPDRLVLWKTDRVDPQKATSWTEGRLHFSNRSLGEAVAEMNRYSERKIVINDPAVAAQQIVGNFRAGDIDAFIRAIRLHGFARVATETKQKIELAAVGY